MITCPSQVGVSPLCTHMQHRKNGQISCLWASTWIHTTLHCTTPHCTTLHCTTLHYTALHCISRKRELKFRHSFPANQAWISAWDRRRGSPISCGAAQHGIIFPELMTDVLYHFGGQCVIYIMYASKHAHTLAQTQQTTQIPTRARVWFPHSRAHQLPFLCCVLHFPHTPAPHAWPVLESCHSTSPPPTDPCAGTPRSKIRRQIRK